MVDTSEKPELCSACESEIRPGAAFCFNCGESLSPEVEDVTQEHEEAVDAEVEAVSTDEDTSETLDETVEDSEAEVDSATEDSAGSGEAASDEHSDDQSEESPDTEDDKNVQEQDDDPQDRRVKVVAKESEELDLPKKSKRRKSKRLAAARRAQRRGIETKLEVVWEDAAESPSFLFPIITLVITFIVAGLFFLALYLK